MIAAFHLALQKLGLRQQAYKSVFGPGSPGHQVLIDMAEYTHAFASDPVGMTHDQVMVMHGRRQAFFRIFRHVKLSPAELEIVCKDALVHAAARLQQVNHGVEE
jgi:hypothetical protein